MRLHYRIATLSGVGEAFARGLKTLGIETIEDLLWYPPFRYIDASANIPIAMLKNDMVATIAGTVISVATQKSPRKRIAITTAVVQDETAEIKVVWFNQPFVEKLFKQGDQCVLHGKVSMNWQTREKTLAGPIILKQNEIVPIYHQTKGLSSGVIRRLVKNAMSVCGEIEDPLPVEIKDKYNLVSRYQAILDLHHPQTFDAAVLARRRLAFDELIRLSLTIRQDIGETPTSNFVINDAIEKTQVYVPTLPFQLTDGQRKVAWEIIQDISSGTVMKRLIMGDVGSGKTVLGAIASNVMQAHGYQSVWLAPTEVLALQHYKTLRALFPDSVSIGLLTQSKREYEPDRDLIVVGTHALLQPNVSFGKIGLVIVDEQHRFGVTQRERLTQVSRDIPHFLSMTATPIPRTLALTLYGDLDISLLDELPSNRKPISTSVVSPNQRVSVYDRIRKELIAGHQAFIIVPLVEESDYQGQLFSVKRSAEKEFERLQREVFPDIKIGLLHGKMKAALKKEVMDDFKAGIYKLLVATSIIEVGIDVPNATVIAIENAESFGLAQLHQLRGRVGRGDSQSYCFLLSDSTNPVSLDRLTALEKYRSGFKLAEIDLELRGPGSLTGLKQSGLPDLKLATLTDTVTVTQAKEAVTMLLKAGVPEALQAEVSRFASTEHFE